MKTIGIIGSRQRDTTDDYLAVYDAFKSVYEPGDWLCSGDCSKGGDRFALKIARQFGHPILLFPPGNERGPGKYFARNDLIAKYSDVLIACVVRFPGWETSGGTHYTIRKWKEKELDPGQLILVEP